MKIKFENLFRRGVTPETVAMKNEAQRLPAFEIMTNQVAEEVVVRLSQEPKLKALIVQHNFPTDEKTCEEIAEKVGIGAEQVAAVSKYEHALEAEGEQETLH